VSDAQTSEPDEDLLEFLGSIDEINEETRDEDFAEFLAKTDIDRPAARKLSTTVEEGKQ
jgi:hypothetical protein